MKKFIIIGFIVAFVIAGAFLWQHFKHPGEVARKMSQRSYKIEPDLFYSNLKHQIPPKDGESDINLLRRDFQEHQIDLDIPKASIFVDEKIGRLFVNVTPEDQDKVERLVAQIVNTK